MIKPPTTKRRKPTPVASSGKMIAHNLKGQELPPSAAFFNKKENWFLNNASENYRNEDDEGQTPSNGGIEKSDAEEPAKKPSVRKKTTLSVSAKAWQEDRKKEEKKGADTPTNSNDRIARAPEDFWMKSTNVDKFADTNHRSKKISSNDEFDVAIIESKDPSMNIKIPTIPPASEVVLVPDTQPEQSANNSTSRPTPEKETGNKDDDNFLFHGQGATANGYWD